jgi:hypothetical protein
LAYVTFTATILLKGQFNAQAYVSLDKAKAECKKKMSPKQENENWRPPQIAIEPDNKIMECLHVSSPFDI